jgi:predicted transcriptional regulator of viral defense system
MLGRLAKSGLVRRLRAGIWKIGPAPVSADVVLPVLTRPYPSYISLWSALFDHGMLDQIPRSVYATSLDRPQTIKTSIGEYRIHHVHPDLFGGFEGQTAVRAGRATPEKALFDTVYVLSTRSGTVTLPELELPSNFDDAELRHWLGLVPSSRIRSMTERNLTRILRTSQRSAA